MAVDTARNASIRRQVAYNAITNYAGAVANLLVGLLMTPFIIRHLSPAEFGLWGLVGSFLAYGSLAEFGVGAALVKYVAEHRARGESEAATRIIATGLLMYTALGILVVLVSLGLAPFVPDLIKVHPGDRGTASTLFILAMVWVAVQMPATAASAVLRAINRYDLMNLLGTLGVLSVAAATVIVMLMGGKVLAIALVPAPLTVLWLIPTVWLIRRSAPDIRFGLRDARLKLLRRVTGFSATTFLLQFAGTLKSQTDEVVIGAARSASDVGPYYAGHRLAMIPANLTFQFIDVLLPLASRLDAEGDPGALQEVWVSGVRIAVALFSVVGGALVVFARPFLITWAGPRFGNSADITVILTLTALIEAIMWPANSVMMGINRHRRLVGFSLGCAALNLTLSIILVGPLGVRGVAFGSLIATGLQAVLVLPYSARMLDVRLHRIAREIVLPAGLPLLPAVAVLVAIQQLLHPASIPTIMLAGLAGAAAYFGCYLAVPGPTGERLAARRLLARLLAASRRS